MDRIRLAPVPAGFGLIFADQRRKGREIIQIMNPRFVFPVPIEDIERLRVMLIVPGDIAAEVIAECNAVPMPNLPCWYRYAIWEGNEHGD